MDSLTNPEIVRDFQHRIAAAGCPKPSEEEAMLLLTREDVFDLDTAIAMYLSTRSSSPFSTLEPSEKKLRAEKSYPHHEAGQHYIDPLDADVEKAIQASLLDCSVSPHRTTTVVDDGDDFREEEAAAASPAAAQLSPLERRQLHQALQESARSTEEEEFQRAQELSFRSAHEEEIRRLDAKLEDLADLPPTMLPVGSDSDVISNGVRYVKLVYLTLPKDIGSNLTLVVRTDPPEILQVVPDRYVIQNLQLKKKKQSAGATGQAQPFAFALNIVTTHGTSAQNEGTVSLQIEVENAHLYGLLGKSVSTLKKIHLNYCVCEMLRSVNRLKAVMAVDPAELGFQAVMGVPRNLVRWNPDDPKQTPELVEATLKMLKTIPSTRIHVLAVVGVYRKGKSSLLNALADQLGCGFDLGHTTKSKTQGIDCMLVPHPRNPGEFMLLLDTEGTQDVEKVYDPTTNIMMLSWLFSSAFIYNHIGVADSGARNALQGAAFLAERLAKTASTVEGTGVEEDETEISHYPSLTWVARDWNLDFEGGMDAQTYFNKTVLGIGYQGVTDDAKARRRDGEMLQKLFPQRQIITICRPVSNDEDLKKFETPEVQQRLKPEFKQQLQEAKKKIIDMSKPKTSPFATELTGEQLVEYFRQCVKAVRDNLDHISLGNTWQSVQDSVNRGAVEAAKVEFETQFIQAKKELQETLRHSNQLIAQILPNIVEVPIEEEDQLLAEVKQKAKQAAAQVIDSRGMRHTQAQLYSQLQEAVAPFLEKEITTNRQRSKVYCEKVVSFVCKDLDAGIQRMSGTSQVGNCNALFALLDRAGENYQQHAIGPCKAEIGTKALKDRLVLVSQVKSAQDAVNKLNADARRAEAEHREQLERLNRLRQDDMEKQNRIQAACDRLKYQVGEQEKEHLRQITRLKQESEAENERLKRQFDAKNKEQMEALQRASDSAKERLRKKIELQNQRAESERQRDLEELAKLRHQQAVMDRELSNKQDQIRALSNRPPQQVIVRESSGGCVIS